MPMFDKNRREGLPVRDGEEILLRDTPANLPEAVVRLLTIKTRRKESAAGGATVRENIRLAKVGDEFAAAL
jgi:hypothetical protein